jgi:PrtD family type I secretion system ABC transporter
MAIADKNLSKPISLRPCRNALIGVGVITGVLNMLMLTGSFYMLEVYDRVVPGRSIPTLLFLSAIAVFLFSVQGLLDFIRSRILVRIGAWLDEQLSGSVFDAVLKIPLRTKDQGNGLLPLRDLDQVRGFLAGNGLPAFFDLPWMPLYLGICYLFHPLIGIAATAGALFLVILTVLTELRTRNALKTAGLQGSRRFAQAEAGRRNADVAQAMGLSPQLVSRWQKTNDEYVDSQLSASDVAGGYGSAAKSFRMTLQSLILGLGAYLAIQDLATSGIIIAASILTARALAPVDLVIANWRSFTAARQSWKRLADLVKVMAERPQELLLPPPTQSLAVENLFVGAPGQNTAIVQDATFAMGSGSALGIIGPSASGKTSLIKAVVGVWRPARGKVRLDGAAIDQWRADLLGPHIGYLPQDVELFDGTIAQNISRFEDNADSEAIIAASRAAGVHDMIVRLPNGYETQIAEGGSALSAGQRQRVALARALYHDPFLVVLDEPNSNLDAEGEEALTQAILGVRARGGIVIIVAHRPSALAAVDKILIMKDGRMQAFGPKDEVLAKLRRPAGQPPVTLTTVEGVARNG